MTIDDIARIANVSKATVSKVINGYTGVNRKTKQLVLEIMRDNNYWPSATARSLTSNRSYLIGLFIASELNNSFFREVIPGIEKTLGEFGYDILYFADKRSDNTGVRYGYLQKCLNRRVDGAIMLSYVKDELADFDELLVSDIPQVYIDLDLKGDFASYVISDNEKSAVTAVKYLYDLGHRKIGFIDGTSLSKPVSDRYKGFKKSINELNIYCQPEWICKGTFTEEYGYHAINELLKLKERPSAIVAQDNIAIGVIQALNEQGLQVPKDFSIVGFDDIEISRHYGLTTVRQHKYNMGIAASNLLLRILSEGDCSPVIKNTELIVRESCRKISNNSPNGKELISHQITGFQNIIETNN